MVRNNTLAVYGTLRKGAGRKGYVEGYFLVHPKGCFFPAIIKGKGRVIVEVYNVDSDELDVLDIYEGNLFERVKAPITLFKGNKTFSAWIYEGRVEDYDRLGSGDWEIEKKKIYN